MKDNIKLQIFPEAKQTLLNIKNTYYSDKSLTWVLNHLLRNYDIKDFLSRHEEQNAEENNL